MPVSNGAHRRAVREKKAREAANVKRSKAKNRKRELKPPRPRKKPVFA